MLFFPLHRDRLRQVKCLTPGFITSKLQGRDLNPGLSDLELWVLRPPLPRSSAETFPRHHAPRRPRHLGADLARKEGERPGGNEGVRDADGEEAVKAS